MTSSLHLRWTLFFSVTGVFKQLWSKWQSVSFLNLTVITGFVGNSYKFVNTAVELFRIFLGFFFFFLFFLEKNTLPSGLVHIAWLDPGPATDLLSSCEGQQSGKRQENSYDLAIYFDHARDLDGQAGMYCCCEMKDMDSLDHLWLLLNLANRNLKLQYL